MGLDQASVYPPVASFGRGRTGCQLIETGRSASRPLAAPVLGALHPGRDGPEPALRLDPFQPCEARARPLPVRLAAFELSSFCSRARVPSGMEMWLAPTALVPGTRRDGDGMIKREHSSRLGPRIAQQGRRSPASANILDITVGPEMRKMVRMSGPTKLDRDQYESAETTSPLPLVPRAHQVGMLMVSLMKRTLPSAMPTFTPPGW